MRPVRTSSPNVRLLPSDVTWAPLLWSWRQEAAAQRYMPLRQATVEDLAARLATASADLSQRAEGEYRWFIEADGRLVGTVALKNVSRAMGHAEIGYHVAEAAQGVGIGSRAVSACLDLAFGDPDFHRIYATISADNLASQGLVRKLGFRREARLRDHYRIQGRFVDQLVFSVLRAEWVVGGRPP